MENREGQVDHLLWTLIKRSARISTDIGYSCLLLGRAILTTIQKTSVYFGWHL